MVERRQPKPNWLRVRLAGGAEYLRLRALVRDQALHTVCEEARCPNIGECWGAGTATFMILGDICTRSCGFCAVTSGKPLGLDLGEPRRLAEAVARMGLGHAVITSVDRDDLSDGGAGIFAQTVRWVRKLSPATAVELLTPDFAGDWDALATVLHSNPDVIAHNLDTVSRLYRRVRPRGRYERALELLRRAAELKPRITVKSGLMIGLGETLEEINIAMGDLRAAGCDILTVGQYLQPSAGHLPLIRYYDPSEFAEIRDRAQSLGFRHVEAGPLVRSSYHAERQLQRRVSA
jgi:lipoic acid synthetase